MKQGTKIALIIGGLVVIGGGIGAFLYFRKKKKEQPSGSDIRAGKIEAIKDRARTALNVTPENESRAKKLVENLNKFNLTPESDLSNYISEMQKMGFVLSYSPKKAFWNYSLSNLVNQSKIKNGIAIV
jgi:LPXTG-motif cell wall-anchored protein